MSDTNKLGFPPVSLYNKSEIYTHAKEFCHIFWLLADEVEKISKDKAAFFRKIADNQRGVFAYSCILGNIKKTGIYVWDEQEILDVKTPNGFYVSGVFDRITVDSTGTHVIITTYFKNKIYHEVAKIEEVQYTEQVTRQELKVSEGLLTEINKLDWE